MIQHTTISLGRSSVVAFVMPPRGLPLPLAAASSTTLLKRSTRTPLLQKRWQHMKHHHQPQQLQHPPPSFSFSGAGFLSPFHIGVVKGLQEKGIITDNSKLAGASGGALVAASTAVGISPEEQMVAYKDMSRVCRANGGFWGKVGGVVRQSLDEHFPENAHEICNERLTIAVMQIWPAFQLQPELLTHFHSRQDLLDCLLTSSHVPLYLNAAQPFYTRFRQGFYVDGGLVDLVPAVPGAIKVCVFPQHALFRKDLHVTPHVLGADFPFSMWQVMRWAFVAPPDDVADQLVHLGHQAAMEWIKTGGVKQGREIDQPAESKDVEMVAGAGGGGEGGRENNDKWKGG